ncbi:MAG: LPS export ABC transporter permease LptG [Burkholderiales bacterium]|nr:LPS export ABC transporter permease LptG [Burkholderiales bacterium]
MILEYYILRKCLFNTFLVLVAFVMLFAIFTTLSELGNLGKGDFNMIAMLIYITAMLPNFTYLLLPLAVLIGVMLGMLGLVSYSEYAIIRTSGMSLRRITAILFVFGFGFTIITFLMGEVIAPQADHFAKTYKITKLKQLVSTNLNSGIWSKDGNNIFINIKQVMPDNTILGVNIYYYTKSLALQKYLFANEGIFDKNHNVWQLKNITTTTYESHSVIVKNAPTLEWKTSIDPSYFSILVVTPEEMSIFALVKYINHLQSNNQSIRRYNIAFWNKLIYPLACLSMAILAIAFIPNNRRAINLGTKLFLGIIIGVAFFFTTKLVGYMAVLFSWNPIISAVAPTLILFACGWHFILRKD